MKLSRKWARISIVLLAAGALLACLGVIIDSYVPEIPGFALMTAAVAVKLTRLRCPYCRSFTTTPQWFRSGNKKCSKCKKLLEYDY